MCWQWANTSQSIAAGTRESTNSYACLKTPHLARAAIVCARETVDSVPNFLFFSSVQFSRVLFFFSFFFLAGHNNVIHASTVSRAGHLSACIILMAVMGLLALVFNAAVAHAPHLIWIYAPAVDWLTRKYFQQKREKQTKDKREEEEEDEAPHQNDDDDGVFSSIASN